MMVRYLAAALITPAIVTHLALAAAPVARQTQVTELQDQLQRDGRVAVQRLGVVLELANFENEGRTVEAIITRPFGDEKRAGLLLVPGHSRTAHDMLPQAIRFARAGFVTMSVSQPGYGGSTGLADFAGPRTFSALKAASHRLASLSFVDPKRLGVYGYSRGALAAAQLATRTDMFRAAVFGGGIYDFRSAFEQISLPGIQANMQSEAGLSEEAIRFRSPVQDIAGLDGPVLIIHGELDENAPPAQAYLLRDRLTALGREHQLMIIAGGTHSLGMKDVVVPAVEFFSKHLQQQDNREGK